MDSKGQLELINKICKLEAEAKHKTILALSEKDIASVFYFMGEEAAYCSIKKLLLDIL